MKSPIYLLLLLERLSENLPAHMEAWKRAAGAVHEPRANQLHSG